MDRSESVRHRESLGDGLHQSAGDRPKEAPSRGESPSSLAVLRGPSIEGSLWPYLSDHQRMSLAFFEVAHGCCGDMTLIPYWLDDLQVVDELLVECGSCRVTRLFHRREVKP